MAKSSLSRASLIDSLRDAQRSHVVMNSKTTTAIHFNSLLIASNELGVLLPAYDNDFMNTLTDLYDCRPYGERKRTSEIEYDLDNPQLNFIAGTTPSYLNTLMPEGAWDQGFISRMLLVYSGENTRKDLFVQDSVTAGEFRVLSEDLQIVSKLFGEMKFTKEAAQAINNWHKKDGPPRPDHPKLLHYNTRRTAHLLKLCMIVSASEGNTLEITLNHYEIALEMLIELEIYMPDIFKAMSSGGDRRIIEDAWYAAYKVYAKTNAPVSAIFLINYLSEKAPAHSVERLIKVMVGADILQERQERAGMTYIPKQPPKE